MSNKERRNEWNAYLKYLTDWIEFHKESEFHGMSPACFNEWEENEEIEAENEGGNYELV